MPADSAQCSFVFAAVGEVMHIDNRFYGDLLNSVMVDLPCKKTLEELKREAIAKLELRGYDVRGKTWAPDKCSEQIPQSENQSKFQTRAERNRVPTLRELNTEGAIKKRPRVS